MNNILKYKKNEEDIIFDLTKSAPNQIKPFPRIEDLCKYWLSKDYKELIDVGCGQLRNSLVLINYFRLWVCEFPILLRRPTVNQRLAFLRENKNFLGIIDPTEFRKGGLTADAAVLAYIIHTLPELQMRIELIESVIKNTKAPHEMFIAVPNGECYYRRRMGMQNKFNDGHFFVSGSEHKTFYREYTSKQLDRFMNHLGFSIGKTFQSHKKNQKTYIKKGTLQSDSE